MENNNKGRGIFYGVIGVATLVVAIVGATFAFFAASDTKGTQNITAGSAGVKALSLDEKTNFRAGLVPVHGEDPNFIRYVGLTKTPEQKGAGTCIDDNGNAICSVYDVIVTNPNENAVDASFSLTSVTNTFENLYYAVFKGPVTGMPKLFTNKSASETKPIELTPAEAFADTDGTAGDGTLLVAPTQLGKGDTVDLGKLDHVIPAKGNSEYTIVLWVQETNEAQPEDVSKAFSAGFTVSTGGNASGVTGVISAA